MKKLCARIFWLAVLVVAPVGCSSGNGGEPNDAPLGTPSAIEQAAADATADLLASSADPSAAIARLSEVVAEAYQDPSRTELETTDLLLASFYDSIQSEADLTALREAVQNTPSVLDGPSLAQADPGSGDPDTVVWYVNGFLTGPWDNLVVLELLRSAAVSKDASLGTPEGKKRLRFKPFYNLSGQETEICAIGLGFGFLSDTTVECPLAKAQEASTRLRNGCALALGFVFDLAEAYDQLSEILIDNSEPEPSQVADLRKALLSDLNQGKKVVAVGHSQGNYFIEQAIRGIQEQNPEVCLENLSVVAIASPARYRGFEESIRAITFVTVCGDLIEVVPFHAAPTFDIDCPTEPLTEPLLDRIVDAFNRHGILTTYLCTKSPMREAIGAAIVEAEHALPADSVEWIPDGGDSVRLCEVSAEAVNDCNNYPGQEDLDVLVQGPEGRLIVFSIVNWKREDGFYTAATRSVDVFDKSSPGYAILEIYESLAAYIGIAEPIWISAGIDEYETEEGFGGIELHVYTRQLDGEEVEVVEADFKFSRDPHPFWSASPVFVEGSFRIVAPPPPPPSDD